MGGGPTFTAMETFWSKAQTAISHIIAEMPPLTSFSVKSGDQFLDIRLEIKHETESASGIKKNTSPSCLRRNHRRLLMHLERDKATVSTEPDDSGTTGVSAGEPPVSTRVAYTPVTQRDGPALASMYIMYKDEGECKHTQNPFPAPSTEGEGTDEQYTTHDKDSNREEDSRDEGENDSTKDEADNPRQGGWREHRE